MEMEQREYNSRNINHVRGRIARSLEAMLDASDRGQELDRRIALETYGETLADARALLRKYIPAGYKRRTVRRGIKSLKSFSPFNSLNEATTTLNFLFPGTRFKISNMGTIHNSADSRLSFEFNQYPMPIGFLKRILFRIALKFADSETSRRYKQ